MWMGAVKKDVLLILYIISIAQVTRRGGIVSPGHSFTSNFTGFTTTFQVTVSMHRVFEF